MHSTDTRMHGARIKENCCLAHCGIGSVQAYTVTWGIILRGFRSIVILTQLTYLLYIANSRISHNLITRYTLLKYIYVRKFYPFRPQSEAGCNISLPCKWQSAVLLTNAPTRLPSTTTLKHFLSLNNKWNWRTQISHGPFLIPFQYSRVTRP